MGKCNLCDLPSHAKGLCSHHYYKNSSDKFKKRNKLWRNNNRERTRELWRIEHSDTIKNTERARKYRQTVSGREATKRAVKKYEKLHPERRKSWIIAEKIKMKPCIICENPSSHRHHPNISKPLEIIFLCPLHHKMYEDMI